MDIISCTIDHTLPTKVTSSTREKILVSSFYFLMVFPIGYIGSLQRQRDREKESEKSPPQGNGHINVQSLPGILSIHEHTPGEFQTT